MTDKRESNKKHEENEQLKEKRQSCALHVASVERRHMDMGTLIVPFLSLFSSFGGGYGLLYLRADSLSLAVAG